MTANIIPLKSAADETQDMRDARTIVQHLEWFSAAAQSQLAIVQSQKEELLAALKQAEPLVRLFRKDEVSAVEIVRRAIEKAERQS